MAAKNSNQTVRRFENGGVLKIDDGTDVATVFNIVPGSLRVKKPLYSSAPFTDRGVQQKPLIGDALLGEIDVDVYAGKFLESTTAELWGFLDDNAASTDGLVKEFTVTIQFPATRGGSSGASITTANASLREAPEYQAGGGPDGKDIVRYRFQYRTETVAEGAF